MTNVFAIIKEVVFYLGVPTIVVALIYIGKKLQLLEMLSISVEKIKNNLNVVSTHLIKNDKNFSSSELQTYSPYNLTDAGKVFIKEIGFHNVFEKYKKDFFDFIESENVKLKYDVEVAAIKSIYALYEKDYMDFLKVLFYNNPKRNLENTAPTLGVYIRDNYLQKHPEITQ